MMSLIPTPYRWLALALISAGLVSIGYLKGISHERTAWDASKAVIVVAETKAIAVREADNSKLAIKQAAEKVAIQKVHDDEIATLHARIAATPRLRVGPSFCDRSTSAASVQDAASSNGVSASARLLSASVDDAVKSLIEQTEEVAATARACQAGALAAGITNQPP